MFCLRPALLEVPEEDWFCAACVVSTCIEGIKMIKYNQTI